MDRESLLGLGVFETCADKVITFRETAEFEMAVGFGTELHDGDVARPG